MMTDWAVWPIFIVQGIAFLLLFFKRDARFLGLRFKTISLLLIFISCIMIAVSLYHDSTEVLKLHF